MKKALIVSYNIIRKGEGPTPLSIASIIAYLKNDAEYGDKFEVDHASFNLLDDNLNLSDFKNCFRNIQIHQYEFIAISAFVWNEYLLNSLIQYLRNQGFRNKIILGGSQITYANQHQLESEYPRCDIFISGYAEKSFLEILKNETPGKSFYNSTLDFDCLPSPYLNQEFPLEIGQEMIRWETKRGCPYKCAFCAHRNLENGRVHYMPKDKAFAELALFKEKDVKRINVLDPIFNIGANYLPILKEIDRLNFTNAQFTFQSKIELLNKKDGPEFLNLIEKTKGHLEFGLQTVIPEEYAIIDRANNVNQIKEQLELLNRRNISYEVSLIYGLPNQTVDSFKASIEFAQSKGCKKITAWPLMLLKGTPLFSEKEKWNLKEEVLGNFNIPVVTSSNTFNKDQWLAMQDIAVGLMKNSRV
ncbi:MAG TPA: radical SAM protein [Bacteroidia bacterium]|nr:radical SAM protein [Bacteroidia bacterium]HRH08444.1 radical SAM protein [Bacteroidia bacterium]